jgi:hypothetical protein
MKNGFRREGNFECHYVNGKLHRDDGPALIHTDGSKFWYKHDNWHRVDGPAVEYTDGGKLWYLNDKRLLVKSQEEFEQYMRLIAFI